MKLDDDPADVLPLYLRELVVQPQVKLDDDPADVMRCPACEGRVLCVEDPRDPTKLLLRHELPECDGFLAFARENAETSTEPGSA